MLFIALQIMLRGTSAFRSFIWGFRSHSDEIKILTYDFSCAELESRFNLGDVGRTSSATILTMGLLFSLAFIY